MRSSLRTFAPLLVAGVLLVGCGGADEDAPAAASDDGSQTGAAGLGLEDGWVKAADKGMTSAFGTLRNGSDADIVLTSVTTEVASVGELHKTEDDGTGTMAMSPAEGGFTIPAGGVFELEPGANHLMLMGLNEPLDTGTMADITVATDDGDEWTFEVPVRELPGAEESYDSGDSGDSGESTSDMGTDQDMGTAGDDD